MTERAQMRIATSVIVLVLGLQFVAVALQLERWAWPFIDYPMYSPSHQEGDRVWGPHSISAKTKDGRELDISAEDLGVNFWLFDKWARLLMAEQPAAEQPGADLASTATAADSIRAWLKSTSLWRFLKSKDQDLNAIFLDMAERRLGIDIVQLRVEDTPFVVTRSGAAPAPPTVVIVDVGSDGE